MFSFLASAKTTMVARENALPGRPTPMPVPPTHTVLKTPLAPPWPAGLEEVVLAFGCFWGAERRMYEQPGVYSTSVGYAGGFTPNPTYEEVCTGKTGHTEVVRVVFDPRQTSLETVLKVFFEAHDPTQVMRQGNDVGTQYRSAIYWTTPEQESIVKATTKAYDDALRAKGFGPVATELHSLDEVSAPFGGGSAGYFYAESYHQQYLDKNPNGYCGLAGTGVSCPIGLGVSA